MRGCWVWGARGGAGWVCGSHRQPLQSTSPLPLRSAVAAGIAPPSRAACNLPADVAIAVHGTDVVVNGEHVEQLDASAERPTALTRLLIPCREHGIFTSCSSSSPKAPLS